MAREASLIAITAALSLLTALVAFNVRAETVDPAADHVEYAPEIVGITKQRLLPTIVVLSPDAASGWLNYSGRDASITFDEDVVARMTCKSKSPFRVADGELSAPRVSAGSFATLCALSPGEYDYRVQLAGSSKVLLGKIVSRSP